QDAYGRAFDEMSNFGPNEISEFDTTGIRTYKLWPQDVGLCVRDVKEIEITDPQVGYRITMEVFQGRRADGDPIFELLALNAGALLYSGGIVASLTEGV